MPESAVIAYSLLVLERGAGPRILAALHNDPTVLEAVSVMGAYDVVLTLKTPTLQALQAFVFDKLRALDGIRSTTTLIALADSP